MIEAVVVGGGIAGCAAALALRQRDVLVTVIDAVSPGAGATGASAGMLAPQYEVADPGALFEWAVEGRRRWPEFAARLSRLSGDALAVEERGMLVANLSESEEERARRDARRQRAAGLEARVVGAAEAERLQPNAGLRAPSWLWLPAEGAVDAQRLPEVLKGALEGAEVRVISGQRVTAVESREGAVTGAVTADGRTLSADRVVLAAGARIGEIDGVPRRTPVRPVKGQLLRFRAGEGKIRRILAAHDGTYLVPRRGGSVVAGSTMEDTGMERGITEEARRSIRDRLERFTRLPGDREPEEQWAGLRPLTPDRRPILGPDPSLEGLLFATGYGRNGILLGPVCGEAVAELAVGGEPTLDWRPFRPGRFEAG